MKTSNRKKAPPQSSGSPSTEELLRERDLLRRYMDAVETVIVALDHQGVITSINKKGCRLLGYSEKELLGRSWFETCLPQPDGLEKVYPVFSQLMAGRIESREYFENPVVTKSGEIRLIAWRNTLLRDDDGRITGTLSAGNDVTERRQMEQALRESEERYRTVADFTFDWEYWIGPAGEYRYISPSSKYITGWRAEELLADPGLMVSMIHPDDRPAAAEHFRPPDDRPLCRIEYRIVTKDGRERWIDHNCRPVYDSDGRFTGRRASNRDITERKKAEQALKDSETKYRNLFNNAVVGIYRSKIDGSAVLEANQALCDIFGLTRDEVLSRPATAIWTNPRARDEMIAKLQNEGSITNYEADFVHKNGKVIHCQISLKLYPEEGYLEGTIIDVTARRKAEENYRRLFNEMLNGFALHEIILDAAGRPVDYRYLAANPAFERMTGLKAANIIGRRVTEVLPGIEQSWIDTYGRVAVTREPVFFEDYVDALKRHFEVTAFSPAPGRFACIFADITERKRAEDELKAWMRRYDFIVAASGQVAYEYMIDSGRITWGTSIEKVLGYTPEEIDGGFTQWRDLLHPDDLPSTLETLADAEKACSYWDARYRMRHKRGEYVWIRDRGFFLPDAHGTAYCQLGMMEDITDQKKAEQERLKLEEQLRQSQKLEAIGRLAGGVAHDFNNMLAVIIGHTELATDRIAPGTPVYADLQAIRKAADHSAGLVRHLLAFARKQTIAPKVIHLNEVVQSIFAILKRLIGEDIDLDLKPQEGLWPVRVDPGQIDQILANLCINARDAIAGPGKIVIETRNISCEDDDPLCHENVPAGDYVRLSVTDSGCGMDAATQGKIFEPFFTTKEVGKGSGLGLSTVYGVVSQNRGFIDVVSAPGRGAAFNIYLPRYMGEQEHKIAQTASAQTETGHETILLVEDEAPLLQMTEALLTRLGYRVLTALTPQEAVGKATEHTGDIHLLITDVVMPDMNGRELADKIRSIRPGAGCLFMSGYTADVIAQKGILEEGVQFIQKPFSRKGLAAKVRAVLDRA